MTRVYVNNYSNILAADVTNVATSMTVSSATGLPTLAGSDYYYLTLDNYNGAIEIVKVTARAGSVLTVVRGQFSTTNIAWAAGTPIEMRVTANSLVDEPGTAGKVLVSDGSQWTNATTTLPVTSAASAGKIMRSDGTNWVASTPTFPNTGTSAKILIGDGTNYVESTPTWPTSASTAGKRIKSDGTNLVMSTTTMPDSGTSGKILRGDGTNYVESTATYPNTVTVNRLLYASASNVISDLATANSSILVTDSSGVPSLSTTLPAHTVSGLLTLNAGFTTNGSDVGDYEVGGWTPVPFGTTTAGSPTGTFAGRFVRWGKLINISGRITFTNLSTMAGNLQISGLPYAVRNSTSARAVLTVGYRANFTTDYVLGGYVLNNTTTIVLLDESKDVTFVAIADLSATSEFYFALTYETV